MRTPTVQMPPVPGQASGGPRGTTPGHPANAAADVAMTAARRMLATSAASDPVWVPFVSATLIVAVGALSLATRQPWLFVALGPTALLLAANPGHPTTRFHAVVVGHVVALSCAWMAILLMGADGAGSGLTVARVWASAFAVAVMAAVQPSLKAYHPPAAATVLLVTLGMQRLTWNSVGAMVGGVLVVAILGEWFQRVRLRQKGAPVQ